MWKPPFRWVSMSAAQSTLPDHIANFLMTPKAVPKPSTGYNQLDKTGRWARNAPFVLTCVVGFSGVAAAQTFEQLRDRQVRRPRS
jgi:hypothetical protein